MVETCKRVGYVAVAVGWIDGGVETTEAVSVAERSKAPDSSGNTFWEFWSSDEGVGSNPTADTTLCHLSMSPLALAPSFERRSRAGHRSVVRAPSRRWRW